MNLFKLDLKNWWLKIVYDLRLDENLKELISWNKKIKNKKTERIYYFLNQFPCLFFNG